MKFNDEIELILSQHLDKERIAEAKLYLLSLHFLLKVPENLFNLEVVRTVNMCGIVDRDFKGGTNNIIFNVPLFISENETNVESQWAWVLTEFREKFKKVRGDAGGSTTSCISKMKKLFVNNPHIRKQDVLRATDLYLAPFIEGRTSSQFLQKADYFIKKSNPDKTFSSRLEEYLEVVKDMDTEENKRNGRYTDNIVR